MTWWVILMMAVTTFINRYAFFAQGLRYRPSANAKRFLSYSSYAVLTAIWAPIMFSVDVEHNFNYAGDDYLIAGAIAALMTLFRMPTIVTVLVSTTVFFILRFAA